MQQIMRNRRSLAVLSACSVDKYVPRNNSSIRAIEKETCPPCLRGSGSGDAAVNDMPGACQSRGVTEPQREGSKADRGILHGESE